MKRIILTIAVVFSFYVLVPVASANVFFDYQNSELDVKFKGIEYVFNADGRQVQSIAELLDTTELYMTGIFYVDSIQLADGNGNALPQPAVYYSNTQDAYVGVLSGLTIGDTLQLTENTFAIYFSGGTIDWYYTDAVGREDIIGIRWDATAGDNGAYVYDGGGTVDFASAEYELFMSYNLVYNSSYTGYAFVTINGDNSLTANFHAYGDVRNPDGLLEDWAVNYFDSNHYNEHDMELDATLNWGKNGDHYFKVNDPALITTAATPEPGTFILMSLGLLLTAFYVRKQKMAA